MGKGKGRVAEAMVARQCTQRQQRMQRQQQQAHEQMQKGRNERSRGRDDSMMGTPRWPTLTESERARIGRHESIPHGQFTGAAAPKLARACPKRRRRNIARACTHVAKAFE